MSAWIASHYLLLKLIHLSAAMLWTASALGAFWFLVVSAWERRKHPDDPEIRRRDAWVRLQFCRAVILEHLAFAVLIPTGFMLMTALRLNFGMGWFAAKVAIVVAVFIPLEIFDVWLSHWHLPRALARGAEAPEVLRRAERLHDVFLWVGGALIVALIPATIYLVVMKPAL